MQRLERGGIPRVRQTIRLRMTQRLFAPAVEWVNHVWSAGRWPGVILLLEPWLLLGPLIWIFVPMSLLRPYPEDEVNDAERWMTIRAHIRRHLTFREARQEAARVRLWSALFALFWGLGLGALNALLAGVGMQSAWGAVLVVLAVLSWCRFFIDVRDVLLDYSTSLVVVCRHWTQLDDNGYLREVHDA